MNYSLQSRRFIVLNHFLTYPNSRSLESPNRSPSKMRLLCRLGELPSRYHDQLHTSLPCRSTLHIRQKFQWTSEQLTSAYLDLQYFHRRSSKFPAENLSLLLEWFTPNSFCTVFWVSSFYLSVNIVLYQFTVKCIENWSMRSLGQWIIESKVYLLSMLGRKRKGSRLQLCFWVVDEVPEKNEWICESRYKLCHQVLKCLFTCILRDFICP